jgi:hypothetical protein
MVTRFTTKVATGEEKTKLSVLAESGKEASQTRDYCGAPF